MVLGIAMSSKQKPWLLAVLTTSLLIGCAQQPGTVISQPEREPEVREEVAGEQPEYTAEQLLQRASRQQGRQQQELLVAAANAALTEANPRLALAIVQELSSFKEPWLQARLPAIELEARRQLQQYPLALQKIEQSRPAELAATARLDFSQSAARLFQQLQQPAKAAYWWLQWDEQAALQRAEDDSWQQLWQQLIQLDNSELEQLRHNAGARTLAWLQLNNTIRQQLGRPDAMQGALQQWQRNYPQMPLLDELPATIIALTELTPFEPQRIAVLLPIHGQLRPHAQAIQNGILAAAVNQPETELFFIDSLQQPEVIQQELQALNIEFVIGPLQRSQVDAIRQHGDWPWPTLFLNQSGLPAEPDRDQYFFSLSLEDEASQLAALFQRRDYRRPVVIHAQNTSSERLAQHFSREWRAYGHQAPELYGFAGRDELEPMIARLLELEASRQRVRQISQLIPGEVESEPHSRRDIDAVYLIADPTQTRLLKPFLDVSVSSTAPSLPVYASSRSHSIQADRTDHRDLAGLTFTEMPWMLTVQQSQRLRVEFDQLFPEQDESLQRLFAMGYDALQLIPKLRQQQQLPALRHQGLTGELSLTPERNIRRQLDWARYSQTALQRIREP
ncbi:hypothetical protein SAMN04488051_106283 [Alkalimonas amylolytica]|uniref:Penicillin-binding protein activator LpoA n=2 Tax=Alkalimonas amylolytica TaxID=152573 RepID=A0A1H4E9M8_ALKAM|nr:hypothetical protein SAMN04488051_106283 [Alkalimonas amylolytica]